MFKSTRHRFLEGLILLTLFLKFGGSARAHVELDIPAGGEVLPAGSVFVITWHIKIPHTSFDSWNLWYATDNDLNWIPIVADLPGGDPAVGSIHTYAWTVPDTPTEYGRIRVHLHTLDEGEYYSYNDAAFTITPKGIPTVGSWGLIAMTSLILCAGTIVMTRQSPSGVMPFR